LQKTACFSKVSSFHQSENKPRDSEISPHFNQTEVEDPTAKFGGSVHSSMLLTNFERDFLAHQNSEVQPLRLSCQKRQTINHKVKAAATSATSTAVTDMAQDSRVIE
jgi:hypothetical protein